MLGRARNSGSSFLSASFDSQARGGIYSGRSTSRGRCRLSLAGGMDQASLQKDNGPAGAPPLPSSAPRGLPEIRLKPLALCSWTCCTILSKESGYLPRVQQGPIFGGDNRDISKQRTARKRHLLIAMPVLSTSSTSLRLAQSSVCPSCLSSPSSRRRLLHCTLGVGSGGECRCRAMRGAAGHPLTYLSPRLMSRVPAFTKTNSSTRTFAEYPDRIHFATDAVSPSHLLSLLQLNFSMLVRDIVFDFDKWYMLYTMKYEICCEGEMKHSCPPPTSPPPALFQINSKPKTHVNGKTSRVQAKSKTKEIEGETERKHKDEREIESKGERQTETQRERGPINYPELKAEKLPPPSRKGGDFSFSKNRNKQVPGSSDTALAEIDPSRADK
ncbi:hypothetical protein JZ751_020428 [Albula glossodonta]|uniref:Uncharacterized protein n=1 Tax=Albula glossodonta TaxID=121402 RepID=A0A8T2MRK4_9TELE|nr:hypothetical protein JZ751_020428 [Albula glossodonta]